VVFNLEQNPQILFDLSADDIHKRQYVKKEEGIERVEIKELIFNKSPMFVPNIYKLSSKVSTQLGIDFEQNLKHLEFIQQNAQLIQDKVVAVYQKESEFEQSTDVDQMLYDGFITVDNKALEYIQTLNKAELKDYQPHFVDKRLPTLFLYFKARNYPDILSEEESEQWFEVVQERLQNGVDGYLNFEQFFKTIAELEKDNKNIKILNDLKSFAERLM
jgi:exodeoxyribonuclease-1